MSVQIVKLLDPMNIVNIPGGLVPKGAYSGVTAYSVGDSVSYNGSSYVCITASTGNLPTDTAYWQLVASKGNTGATGLQGPAGTTDYNELDNLPTLGTAAAKDIPATGNASATEVVYGTDTRLTDSRPASDVSAWAKAPTKPTYTNTEVGAAATAHTHAISDTTGLQTALDTKATTTALDAHANNTANPHSVTKAQVGLGNANNTSDADKPVSTAQQTALDAKANASDTVNLTGDQTVAGVKTFSSSPVVPTATTSTQAVNKSQMDTADALKVNKAGDTMTGALNTQDVRGSAASTYNLGQTSNRYFNVFVERVRLGSTELTMLSGTGFPNGVVSASVGSIYIDTDVTNGASSWIKKSGTGSTGWQVLEGDTGWRDVAHSGLSSGSIRLRRLNNNVYVFIGGGFWGIFALTESPAAYAVPTGFKIGLWTSLARMVRDSGKTDAGHIQIDKGNGSVILFYPTVPAGTSVLLTSALTYVTSDPWPTTLPGVPA